MDTTSHIAAIRFGTGPRPDQAPPADPIAWLDAQTRGPAPALPLPPGRDAPFSLMEGYAAWVAHDASPPPPGQQSPVTQILRAEQAAWLRHLLASATPFHDRLTQFWLNHFTVAERGGFGVSTGLGPLLRDAIRPHVTGRFVDMLLAVSLHPAMLYYLDQTASVGPQSPFGRRSGRGLNENLAREILELHTLSPAGGYGQADVTEFARIMTGWGVERLRPPFGTLFRPGSHEPGEKTLLGRRFPGGPQDYEAALRLLADHPATHRFLATRLVRHFVADAPPAAAVTAIATVLAETGGDLGAAARALVRLPQAWDPPLSKLRAPQDYVLALHRAAGGTEPGPVQGAMAALGQPLWNAPQPNGWADTAAAWVAPEPMMQRLDIAYETAGRYSRRPPLEVLQTALGPMARDETVAAVRRAGSARDAIALVFSSPEMQRR
ncbi:DUF1800 domain-containing protein [Falsiroseomonas selenitidurans]|uniref:DUF1800 domain-containing protein n=1 Tax=Falsiroseomonas selenitidurans TaxID=2716335 RepID=A0ABX1EAP7_9PROT|nr:DUF1800 domain-containing protein [Falsiroseomonas selenitidurans]NKC34295.1 DUF1800 domain-containing protein [Falsiroseomonas selenitidurans]